MDFLEFGNYRIDPDHLTLLKDGQVVALQPKVVETLLVLAEKHGNILSKKELMDRLWPDTFVEEANLKQYIFLLRKALGDETGHPRYIETIPRRGYRFLIEAKWVNESGEKKLVTGEARSPAPMSESRSKASKIYVVLSSSLVVILIAVIFLTYIQKKRPAPEPIPPPNMKRLTIRGDIKDAAISQDSRVLAYVSAGNIWIQDTQSKQETQLTDNAAAHYRGINFSRDGKFIYFGRGKIKEKSASLFRIPVGGGDQEEVISGVDSQVAFSPDGTKFCFVREDEHSGKDSILIARSDGTETRTIATLSIPDHISVEGLDWSPDGREIVFPVFTTKPEFKYRILILNLETGEKRQVGNENWAWLMRVVYGKNGKELVFSGRLKGEQPINQLWRMPVSGGKAKRITNDFRNYGNPGFFAGMHDLITIQQEVQADILVIENDGSLKQNRLTTGSVAKNGYNGLDWTPDNRIVYTANENGFDNLWIVNSDGTGRRKLTSDSDDDDHFPSVSHDGRHVAFVSHRSGPPRIWRIGLEDVTGLKELTQGSFDLKPNYSQDGKWLIYSGENQDQRNIIKIPASGAGKPATIRLTEQWSDFPAVSADGSRIAFLCQEKNSPIKRIGIISIDGGSDMQFLDIPIEDRPTFRWHPEGKSLCYLDPTDNFSNIWIYPLDGKPRYKLTDFKTDRIFYYAWSRDGRKLAVSQGRTNKDVVLLEGIN